MTLRCHVNNFSPTYYQDVSSHVSEKTEKVSDISDQDELSPKPEYVFTPFDPFDWTDM